MSPNLRIRILPRGTHAYLIEPRPKAGHEGFVVVDRDADMVILQVNRPGAVEKLYAILETQGDELLVSLAD